MTAHYKTKAFVFKKNNINESDRVFSVFTDDFGRLDIFAKAIRKSVSKLRSGIDIFFISEIEFIRGKTRKTLTDTLAINKFQNVRQNLEKFKIANGIGEILDNFIKGEERDQKVFDLLNDVFLKLDNNDFKAVKCQLLYYYFLWNALSILGYHPVINKCNVCGEELNPYNIYFSNESGGVICKKCLQQNIRAQKINSDIIKILRLIFRKEWDILSRLKIEESSRKLFKEISDSYYSYTLSSKIA